MNPLHSAALVGRPNGKGDPRFARLTGQKKRRKSGGEGVSGDGGADGELGGQVGDQVVGQNREILDGLFGAGRDETEAGVNGRN